MALALTSHALVALPDEALAEVEGRDGVSMVIDGAGWSTSSMNYTQDGETLSLKGLRSLPVKGSSGLSVLKIDALTDRVGLSLSVPQTEYRIDDMVLSSGSAGFGSLRGFIQTNASLVIKPAIQPKGGGVLLPLLPEEAIGLSLDGDVQLSNGTAYLRYDGYDLIAKGIRLGANFTNTLIKLPSTTDGNDIRLEFSNAAIKAGITGLSMDMAHGDPVSGGVPTPTSPDTRDPNYSRSIGSFSADFNVSGSLTLSGGGAVNEGLRIKPDLTWASGVLEYKDAGVVRASDFSGSLKSTSGLTVDLENDTAGSHIKFAAEDLSIGVQLGRLVLGDPANSKLGGVGLELNFQDTDNFKNWFKLYPGGYLNTGLQGIKGQMSWNIASGFASITDNNNTLWLSGFKSHGSGGMTLDLTKSCSTTVTIPGCLSNHFDGLRLGFSGITGSYSLDGLRVGTATAPLQGGTELLLLAGVFPAYDFTLWGQITVLPGGKTGDGIRFNADLQLWQGNAAISTDEFGKGIWLTDTTYEMRYRNGTIDVTSSGLELNKGEYWSILDAKDLRLGTKATGTSMGRFMLRTYEMNSMLMLATGGAGALCVGAVATSATSCATAGGRWEDRGDEGLSVKLKSFYVRDAVVDSTLNGVVTDDKRNQIALEARRTLDDNGKPVNGTGVQVVLDNFWSSDAKVGDANANSYGFNADLGIDVAPTIVISKTPPYTQSSPLGFAVNGRVSFKEIGAERLQLVHPTGGGQTVLHGMRLQNADVRFNLTATPIN